MANEEKIEFWDKKILKWESDKYQNASILKKLANSSVVERRELFCQLAKPFLKDKVVFEFGCGSAHLMNFFLSAGVKKYIGYDFSEEAINNAKKNIEFLSESDQNKIELRAFDENSMPKVECDLFFSLGLLDWMDKNSIETLFSKVQSKWIIHSYSERRLSLQQILHKIYVFFMYAYKKLNYQPNYYSASEILLMTRQKENQISFVRNSKLSFGTFMHNLSNE